ncbi:TIGR04282 family arsenosugar biosynthesis glycosyltransferase [Prauserella flavalba]|uniref:Glycosyltransferase involved in cell wall biogenesis n=1 Tax=Prauserella flavalba TaxID=1477506 RepID=A0A318LZF4_9PSEU|nr:DUF2064 domain-containing protein [Prauserella flavalba]PXY20073.1 glycosyltransferase involved in cell wall biogenesis [Prauserella flavalba]
MSAHYAVLVVAKAPVPGLAKTRLCPPATPAQAAELAAAALLDTLDAVLATPGTVPVVALTGELQAAARSTELRAMLRRCTLIPQHGKDFAERLVHAHADTAVATGGLPVLQLGMDTPQITPALLHATADLLRRDQAVLGPAEDGGWWALALRDPGRARALGGVPMSRPDTGALTRKALESAGLRTATATRLSDVDTMRDAELVARKAPGGRFAAALRTVHAR